MRAQTIADRLEVIVVDNGSSDDWKDATTAIYPNGKTLEVGHNSGFASACNRAAKEASGSLLLLVNPDCVLGPDVVEMLANEVDLHEKAGLVTARLVNPDGSFQANCRVFPTPSNVFFARGSFAARIPGLNRVSRAVYTLGDLPEVTEVPAVSATVAMIRADRFAEMRGFDERFFMYMEDTDLCYRLHLAGYENLYVPHAIAVHKWGKGGQSSHGRRVWRQHRSVWQYFLKHHPNGFTLLVMPVMLLINLLGSLVFGVRKQGS